MVIIMRRACPSDVYDSQGLGWVKLEENGVYCVSSILRSKSRNGPGGDVARGTDSGL
jgi:hypothetical protein